jgi:hypothetical protein
MIRSQFDFQSKIKSMPRSQQATNSTACYCGVQKQIDPPPGSMNYLISS